MDNEMTKMLITEMVRAGGWAIVKQWMDDKAKSCAERLLSVEPTDIVKITELQTTAKNYKMLINFVESNIIKS